MMRPAFRSSLLFLLLASLAGTSHEQQTGKGSLSPGNHQLEIEHAGRTRTYIVHVPPPRSTPRPFPVVMNFHGGGGHAASHQRYTQMDPLADREGFLVVYPNGTGRMGNRFLTWNAGSCCGYAATHQVDDVGFVISVLDQLGEMIPLDRERVYATGLSNGAMMAYRLAVEASDQIAAIAPVAGGMVVNGFEPARPVPVLHIHSIDDPRALYHGGLGPPFPATTHRVLHPNIDQMLAQWVAHNRCPPEPRKRKELQGEKDSAEANHTATQYVYAPCTAGTEVVLWKLTGAGHVWPGGQPNYLPWLLGPSTKIIDGNAEMWKFFSRYRRSREPVPHP
jgi:polyhydroxybutyrate depolymerase